MTKYLTLFLLFGCALAHAQVFKKEVLTVNLISESFDKVLPYDEPFRITGDLSKWKGAEAVELRYKLKEGEHAFWVNKRFRGNSAPMITLVKPDSVTFTVDCEGVTANHTYTFTFLIYSSLKDEKLKASIKKVIASNIRSFLDSTRQDFSSQQLLSLERKIDNAIKVALSKKHYFKIEKWPGLPVEIDMLDNRDTIFRLGAIRQQVNDLLRDGYNRIRDFKSSTAVRKELDSMLTHPQPQLASLLDAATNPAMLTENGKKILDRQIDTVDKRFAGHTIRNFKTYLQTILRDQLAVDDILDGGRSFNGRFLEPSQVHDTAFLNFLYNYFTALEQTEFKPGQKPTHFDATLLGLRELINIYLSSVLKYMAALRTKANLESTLPDLIADYYVAEQISFEDEVSIDMASSSSPYIGLNAGVGYNGGFRNFFALYGVNVYLLPVKKRVPLRNYRDHPLIYALKSTCLTIGIIHNYYESNANGKRYEPLLGSGNDLMIGVGHRLNRALQINVGSALYFRKAYDPAVDDRSIAGKICVSLTVDADLLGGLTNVGKALKIIQ
ncbi:hypothetical protein [Chitinophaga sp. YIM B06452]|uniref:hypothetical protein n=1 Tax=Chitinophaga sp. YIM B06452 TaxID=3082158 RepID=UPI0031FE4487